MGGLNTTLSNSKLLKSIKDDQVEDVATTLTKGVNPNCKDSNGRSALHVAVQHGNSEIIALLLAHGADHSVEDRDGNPPFSPKYVSSPDLHRIRQHYRRMPAPNYVLPLLAGTKYKAALNSLKEKGIAKLSGCIAIDDLSKLQHQFEAFPHALDVKIANGEGNKIDYDEEEHYWSEDKAYVSNNAFRYSDCLAQIACSPSLLDLARNYYAKPVLVKRAMAMRYLPSSTKGGGMFTWHHDVEDKMMKVMILLTDVSDTDQYMSYIEGSHLPYRRYESFFNNELNVEE
jgi:hypothetical protein